jgi:hypothetical protein
MSYFDRRSPGSKPASKSSRRVAADWATAPLTASQKTKLVIAARAAFEIQREAGLAGDDFEAWRHEQVFIACGRAGLREATNAHFRSIEGHFARLAGNEKKAREKWSKTGRVQGSTEIHDTHENRDLARALLRDLVAGSAGLISDDYCEAICRDKSEGRGLFEASARELQNVVITVTSRLRAKRRNA